MGNKFREKPAEELQQATAPAAPAETTVDDEVQEVQDTVQTESKAKGGKAGRAARGIGRVLGGDMLADRLVLRQIPLVLLCLIYLLLIVANRYRVESLSREKMATEERINDLREERIQMQKQYQRSVKISQIAEELSETGVGITSGPPYEL